MLAKSQRQTVHFIEIIAACMRVRVPGGQWLSRESRVGGSAVGLALPPSFPPDTSRLIGPVKTCHQHTSDVLSFDLVSVRGSVVMTRPLVAGYAFLFFLTAN